MKRIILVESYITNLSNELLKLQKEIPSFNLVTVLSILN